MHVVLDFNPVVRTPFSGFWTYGLGLLEGLLANAQVAKITLLMNRSSLARAQSIQACRHPKAALCGPPLRLRRLEQWWRWVQRPTIQRWCGQFDVYHSVHHLMPPAGGRPRVLTVHDLRRYRLPELYEGSDLGSFERAVAKADFFIAVSQTTKRDLCEIMAVDESRVFVAYESAGDAFVPASSQQAQATRQRLARQLGRPVGRYVVAIGSPDRRKNLPAAVAGFSQALPNLPADVQMLIVGKTPARENLLEAASPEARERLMLTGPVEENEFPCVLAAAEALVFPSLYEGFGLPLIEAMSAGVPVIASNRSCMPEVVGQAGLLTEPDGQGIAQALARLMSDADLRAKLIASGLERRRQFTWKAAAERTVECYQAAIAANAT